MCARYTLTQKNVESLKSRFKIEEIRGELKLGRYNIAPTQNVPVLFNNGGKRTLAPFRWGLIPSWAKEPAIGTKMINARVETLTEKVSFKHLLKHNRCMAIADGFYEWTTDGSGKYPMRFTKKNSDLFAFAGLWDRWNAPNGTEIRTFTIITTNSSPHELIRKHHERMPLILTEETEGLWLQSEENPQILIEKILQPLPSIFMENQRVSTLVNSPRNDSEAILK